MKFLVFLVVITLTLLGVNGERVQDGRRLIKTSAEKPAEWLTQKEIFELIARDQKFVDISSHPELDHYVETQLHHVAEIPTELKYNATVRNLISRIDPDYVMDKIDGLSNGFFNRYFNGTWGQAAQLWWQFGTVEKLVQEYSGTASVSEVDHGFMQNSIVVRLEGTNNTLKDQVVVLGAHFDSISRDGAETLAPGADDNGAGSVVILEALRVFIESGLRPQRTVEFHWYAGEEAGLLGSQAIAEQYKAEGINVVAMLNQDVIGYYTPGIDDIGLHTDNANDQMIDLVKLLTDEYLSFGRRNMSCGYGCSDHASWTMNGFPAVMTTAVVSNPAHHRHNDTIEAVDARQTQEFVKLSVAFLVEMSEPQNSATF